MGMLRIVTVILDVVLFCHCDVMFYLANVISAILLQIDLDDEKQLNISWQSDRFLQSPLSVMNLSVDSSVVIVTIKKNKKNKGS